MLSNVGDTRKKMYSARTIKFKGNVYQFNYYFNLTRSGKWGLRSCINSHSFLWRNPHSELLSSLSQKSFSFPIYIPNLSQSRFPGSSQILYPVRVICTYLKDCLRLATFSRILHCSMPRSQIMGIPFQTLFNFTAMLLMDMLVEKVWGPEDPHQICPGRWVGGWVGGRRLQYEKDKDAHDTHLGVWIADFSITYSPLNLSLTNTKRTQP